MLVVEGLLWEGSGPKIPPHHVQESVPSMSCPPGPVESVYFNMAVIMDGIILMLSHTVLMRTHEVTSLTIFL